MRYKAILMDADDTLFDFHQCERNAIVHTLEHIGITDPDAPSVYSRLNRVCWTDFENGLITQARLKIRRFEELLNTYGVKGFAAPDVSGYYESMLANEAILLDGALETVQKIAEKRPIAIVTNGIARCQRGRMAISPIGKYTSALIISEEIGCQKPNPKMIEAALEALGGIKPEEALMVGDSLNSDMRCAQYAGVDGCWYNPKGHERPNGIAIRYEIDDIRDAVEIALQ